jgi:hypothetical protein
MEQPNYNRTIIKMLIIFAIIIAGMFILVAIGNSRNVNSTIEGSYCKKSGGVWNFTDCNYKDGTSKSKEQISLEINSTV